MSTGMGSLICSAQRGLLLWYSTKEWYSSAPGSPAPAATWLYKTRERVKTEAEGKKERKNRKWRQEMRGPNSKDEVRRQTWGTMNQWVEIGMCRKKPPPECQSSESDVVYMRAFMCVRGLRAVAVAGGAAAVAAGLYLSLFSVQGRSSAGNHRGRLSERCTRNGQHSGETLCSHLGQRYLNEECCFKITHPRLRKNMTQLRT